MKSLVVFYSRTGTTRKVAESISASLGCDVEEIINKKNRAGFLGWLKSGMDAFRKKLTEIEEIKGDPALYDLVIIGTPVWNSTMSSAVRTCIHQNRKSLKTVAFFCTQDGSESNVFKEMGSLCEKAPLATLKLRKKK